MPPATFVGRHYRPRVPEALSILPSATTTSLSVEAPFFIFECTEVLPKNLTVTKSQQQQHVGEGDHNNECDHYEDDEHETTSERDPKKKQKKKENCCKGKLDRR
jgi:hypothetical protein